MDTQTDTKSAALSPDAATQKPAAPTEAELAAKLAELASLATEADSIAQVLQQNKPHDRSPFIGPIRSKATALMEMIGRHVKWVASLPKPEPKPEADEPAEKISE